MQCPQCKTFLTSITVKSRTVACLWLVARFQIFRRLMKGKFYAYVVWPLTKNVQTWIVDRSTARDFMVYWNPVICWHSISYSMKTTSVSCCQFFPIWIIIVLFFEIWEISRNKLKKHSLIAALIKSPWWKMLSFLCLYNIKKLVKLQYVIIYYGEMKS